MDHPDYFRLFVAAMLVMGMAHTITRERIFAPLRERLGGKETWFGYLCSCPYCASHWIAFVIVPLTGAYCVPIAPSWGIVSSVLRWFLSSVFLATAAAFLRIAFLFIDESQGLLRRREKKEDLEIARVAEETNGANEHDVARAPHERDGEAHAEPPRH